MISVALASTKFFFSLNSAIEFGPPDCIRTGCIAKSACRAFECPPAIGCGPATSNNSFAPPASGILAVTESALLRICLGIRRTPCTNTGRSGNTIIRQCHCMRMHHTTCKKQTKQYSFHYALPLFALNTNHRLD